MPHLCSFGCKYTPGVVMHHFPNPDKFPERFKAWVNLVGGKLETSSDYRYYKKKMVCDIHFIDDHRNRYKRLNALAVPTLHLHGSSHTLQNNPATTVATENEPCPSLPTTGSSHTLQNIPSTSTVATENEPCPSLPTTGSSHTLQNIPSTSTLATENQPCSSIPTTGPSDTLPNIPSTVATGNQPCSSIPLTKDETYAGVIASAITREHNYSVNSNRKILKGAQKRKPLYPEPAKTNRLEIRRLQSEICRLRKKGASFKQRLETAQKFSEDVFFQRAIKKLQRPAQLFLRMQLQSKKKPKEPGYYKAGEYGIRHEDMVEVVEVTRDSDHPRAKDLMGDFDGRGVLGLRTLTMVPHQTACVDVKLLDDFELSYINAYHARVLATLGPVLRARNLIQDLEWLQEECKPLRRG